MNKIISLLLVLVLVGCSKSGDKADTEPGKQEPAASAAPNQIALEDSPEAKEQNEIEAKAKQLLDTKDFAALDALAKSYRDPKAFFPDGSSKLRHFYTGLCLKQEAPDASFATHFTRLHDWLIARPDSITARMALADALISYAWKARGTGYANSVSNDGWKLMFARLKQAVQVLEDSDSLTEKCPFRWSLMLAANLGLQMPKPEYQTIFKTAVESAPDFKLNYYCQMTYFLMPRWYGRPGELRYFLRTSAEKIGGEDGDVLYAHIVWYLCSGVSGNTFIDDQTSWDRADRGFQILEKRYPDSTRIKCQRLYVALMGCDNVDLPKQLVAGLHGKIDPTVWSTQEEFKTMTKCLYSNQTAHQ